MPPPGYQLRSEDSEPTRPTSRSSRSSRKSSSPSPFPSPTSSPSPSPSASSPADTLRSKRPTGYNERSENDERDKRIPAPPRTRRASASPARKPSTNPSKRHRDLRPLEVGATSLGTVTVTVARPLAILIEGGETVGQNWIPRSQILDGALNRRAREGDRGELWVPSWLADKIPW